MTLPIVVSSYIPAGGQLRMQAVERTLASWRRHFLSVEDMHIVVADDGSEEGGVDWWRNLVGDGAGLTFITGPRVGVGGAFNRTLPTVYNIAETFYWSADDWSITSDLDLTPWVGALRDYADLGYIRLAGHNPFLRGGLVTHVPPHGWGIVFARYSYVWNMKPGVYHRRFFDAYGPLREGLSAAEVDRLYNENFCDTPSGPEIMQALFQPFLHVASIELGDLAATEPVPPERLIGELSTNV